MNYSITEASFFITLANAAKITDDFFLFLIVIIILFFLC